MSDYLEFFCGSCGEHLRVPGTTTSNKNVKCPWCDWTGQLPQTAIFAGKTQEEHAPSAEPQPPRYRISSIASLEDAFRIFGSNILLFGIGFIGLAALDGIPSVAVAGGDQFKVDFNAGSLILTLLGIFISIGMTRMALHVARGGQADLEMLFSGTPWFFRVVIGNILFWVATVAGLVCFILPGLYVLTTYWSFSHFIIDQNCDIMESFRRARTYSVGNRFGTIRIALLSMVVTFLGLACFVVGLLVAIPVVGLMWTTAYLAMTGQSVNVRTQPQPVQTVAI